MSETLSDSPTGKPSTASAPTSRTRRRIFWLALLLPLAALVAAGAHYAWWIHVDYRFRAIEAGALYQSGAMPPDTLKWYVERYGIRTVLDLRDHRTADIDAEREALADTAADHATVPMPPDPSNEQLQVAVEIMLDKAKQPVLVHCHHGEGRSVMAAALYRVFGQDMTFDEALRLTARVPAVLSPLIDVLPAGFDRDDYKTKILENYVEYRRRDD